MFRVAKTNHNLSSMFRYNINGETITHGFVLAANLQSLVDLNEFTKPNSKSNSRMANLSYQFGLPKKSFSASVNVSYTVAEVAFGKTIFYGPTLGLIQSMDKGNLGLNASISYQLQRNNNLDAGNIFNVNFNGSYRLGKRNAANLSLGYLKSNSKDATLPSFNELRSNLGLTHSF